MLRLRCLLPALVAVLALAPAAAHAADNTYQVGVGAKSIAVNADGSFGGAKVYLGGFGAGSAKSVHGVSLQDRFATGNLGVGPSVRAFVVSDGHTTFAVADAEVQGWFAADREGPFGIMDARRQIAAATNGAITADHVVIQSDHTHGGPDLLGVWGGTSAAYRKYVLDQTVAAVKQAYDTRQSGTLYYGTAPGRDLLNNQFDYDAANKLMDSDVRVLQARDADGHAFATLLNFSAHADVAGASNTLATGDWVQETNLILDRELDTKTMTVVGTLGRTQPRRGDCPWLPDGSGVRELCKVDEYSQRVADRAKIAIAGAQEITGKAVVVANTYLITDPSSNPALLGLMGAGTLIGAPLYRAVTPPYLSGNVLGTSTGSARIGDVLLSSGPGEMYPQIPLKVRGTAEQETVGIRGYMTAGLADDQLGYIIAPWEAYPQPIKTNFFDSSFANGDVIAACQASPGPMCAGNPTPKPIGNDNYFFNVSHTMGERLTCSLLRGAGEVFGHGSDLRNDYDRCQAFANDIALPEGSDVTAGDAAKGVPAIPASIPPGN
jgi:hypothetical protein